MINRRLPRMGALRLRLLTGAALVTVALTASLAPTIARAGTADTPTDIFAGSW